MPNTPLSQSMVGVEFFKPLWRWVIKSSARKSTTCALSNAAARTISAYIDLNPVRAGMVADPADYRWSSYGEAIGGGNQGNGKTARIGLIRAYLSDSLATVSSETIAEQWREVTRLHRRMMGISLGKKSGRAQIVKTQQAITHNRAELLAAQDNQTVLQDLAMAKLLRCRVRYFSDGAVIGSRKFVNEAFNQARERFGKNRRDGARKLKGNATAAAGILWSLRDLRA